jgi:hypothetical protein
MLSHYGEIRYTYSGRRFLQYVQLKLDHTEQVPAPNIYCLLCKEI